MNQEKSYESWGTDEDVKLIKQALSLPHDHKVKFARALRRLVENPNLDAKEVFIEECGEPAERAFKEEAPETKE
jgi:hypothetical protein